MYKYVLFDFDGTLIDTNELIIHSLNEVSRKFFDRDLTDEELNSILGKYLDDQMKFLSQAHYPQMVLHYKECYRSLQDTMVQEFAGVAEMLRELRLSGCKTAIVSAKGRSGIEHGLKLFNLQDYFDVIISAYDIENNKPHPEPALKALAALGAPPHEALLVGDSPYDILCGKNAGIRTVLVDWTIFPSHSFADLNPDYVIKSPADLVAIVKQGEE